MKQIYVIIHDWCLDFKYIGIGNFLPIALIKLKLLWIKTTKEHYKVINLPTKIPENLPPASANLEVLICGAFTKACVKFQCDSLIEKGYNARIYYPACFQPSDKP